MPMLKRQLLATLRASTIKLLNNLIRRRQINALVQKIATLRTRHPLRHLPTPPRQSEQTRIQKQRNYINLHEPTSARLQANDK